MISSSDTTVVAPDIESAARTTLMGVLWWYDRKDRWPTTIELARRESWRGPEVRNGVLEFLIENGYFLVNDDKTISVTPGGRDWVAPPSIVPQTKPQWLAIPSDTEDETEVFLWVESYHKRNGSWPGANRLKDAGVRRRIEADEFNEALDALIEKGQLVRIGFRRGLKSSLLTVSLRWCPWLAGRNGQTFWWPQSLGPFPE